MKYFLLFLCTLILIVSTGTESKAQQHFEPTWESLAKNSLPEWVKDAKFGVTGAASGAKGAKFGAKGAGFGAKGAASGAKGEAFGLVI